MALSVGTPAHLSAIGLLNQGQLSPEDAQKQDINFLLYQALQKIAFLPFGYLIDNYRWDVFSGKIPYNKLNEGSFLLTLFRKNYNSVFRMVAIASKVPGHSSAGAANGKYGFRSWSQVPYPGERAVHPLFCFLHSPVPILSSAV